MNEEADTKSNKADERKEKADSIIATERVKAYFNTIQQEITKAHNIASQARKQNYDPEKEVEIRLAKNMAERVVGLISVVAPQLTDSNLAERISELEEQYGSLDWRVAFTIGLEIAQEKFCKFETKTEAIEVGIRAGFAYITMGTVSSPLDGFYSLEIRPRLDKKGDFFRLNFAGPIRNAGGTAASVCVLIADHIRKKLGYAQYDAQPDEIKRAITELQDYHDRVTNLQYFPSEAETEYLIKNIPVEIAGEPSEKIEVSNYKDLPRIETNQIRSGYCLVLSSCIPLKAPKLWKQLSKWGKDFDMGAWNFLEEFLKIQKKAKAKGETKKSDQKITKDYTFITDLVAGRPVLSHPMAQGGFRLRYGRSRVSGYSAQSMHPATMFILNQYIATGTQLKVERPGKAASMTSCTTIEGPIVKLKDGSVIRIDTIEDAQQYYKQIEEILYLGDLLISYGDFFDRAHPLVPCGYNEEWWVQEMEKAMVNLFGTIDTEKTANLLEEYEKTIQNTLKHPTKTDASLAIKISKRLNVPLHPKYTPHWNALDTEESKKLISFLRKHNFNQLPITEEKRFLELIGLQHKIVDGKIILSDSEIKILKEILNKDIEEKEYNDSLEMVNAISNIKIRDKSGTFIGARMGRPEKAKMRKMTGSPHVLFPIGEEGGRFRSFQGALEKGYINAEIPKYYCENCGNETYFPRCENCGANTKQKFYCPVCGWIDTKTCQQHGETKTYAKQKIPIKPLIERSKKILDMKVLPELIKGVRGTSSKDHTPEHIIKGLLRAKYKIHITKDGTTRYDMTQLPLTHFKPKEIGTTIERLRELGYTKDYLGNELQDESQICELLPQDIILPDSPESPDEGTAKILTRTTKFVDELLEKLYKLKPYYKVKKQEDLTGQLVICLAPHTSAGIIGRIIGFTKTQGFFASPLMHAATRRDCDGDEASILLLMDAFLNFSKKYLPSSRGATMDAPLVLTSLLTPCEVDDMAFNMDIVDKYPLELYEAAQEYKMPWEVNITKVSETLHTEKQYEGFKFTHDTDDFNKSVRCSAYKTLPSMGEKLDGQMQIARKVRAVNTSDVARLVIEKHFLKDTKGNLRKFSMQVFRCVNCNEKYRRPPLKGRCLKCGGKIIFTIAEGSVVKYFEATQKLAEEYNVSNYLKQTIMLLQRRLEDVFGKEKEKQTGLNTWC
ncbi:DNA polymerase II large subunit [Candidatus Woesearchaeota archaeon]|nr:MAG: DNA polymerase II large subunit [Candidatus Woesearchaeota archaeon]